MRAATVHLLLLAFFGLSSTAHAQKDPEQAQFLSTGFEFFQAILQLHDVNPITEKEFESIPKSNVIVIVWGAANENTLAKVHATLGSKGAALIAANEPMWFQTRTGSMLSISRGFLATDAFLQEPLEGAFKQFGQSLMNNSRPVHWLVTSPSGGVLEGPNINDRFETTIARYDFKQHKLAYAQDDAFYRFVLLGDQYVLANGPLLQREKRDNLAFAVNLVRFLKDEKRTHCLFYDRGQLVDHFDPLTPRPMPAMPLPPWRELQRLLTDGADRMVDRAENQDAFNRTILGDTESQDSRFQKILQGLAVALAACTGMYLLRKVWNARPNPGPAANVTYSVLPQADTLVGQRSEELLRRDNFDELARTAARELFIVAGSPMPADAELPPIEFPRGRSASLGRDIEELWRMVFGPVRQSITLKQWQEVERQVNDVHRAWTNGTWRFAAARSAPE